MSSIRRTASSIGFHVTFSAASKLAAKTISNAVNPPSVRALINSKPRYQFSTPVDGQLALVHDHVLLPPGKFHQVHQQLDVVPPIFAAFFFLALTPPLNNFQASAGFLLPERLSRQIVEFDAMSKL